MLERLCTEMDNRYRLLDGADTIDRASDDWYDVWYPELSPSPELVAEVAKAGADSVCVIGAVALVAIGLLGVWERAGAQGALAVRPVTPRVLSGGDFGFRVEGVKGETPVGRLVVRQQEGEDLQAQGDGSEGRVGD